MSDATDFTVRVPLTAEQMKMLEDPAALAFVEREIAEWLRREWVPTVERYFLYGPEVKS